MSKPGDRPHGPLPTPRPGTRALVSRGVAALAIVGLAGCGGADQVPPQVPPDVNVPPQAPPPDLTSVPPQAPPPQVAPPPPPQVVPPQAPPPPPPGPPPNQR